jgi:hypothetical protein
VIGKCRKCGCTDLDCSGCVERTGLPCFWVEPDLCSACAPDRLVVRRHRKEKYQLRRRRVGGEATREAARRARRRP